MSEQFKVGQKIKGTISNITDFGIFVQIMPGIDGLVHISDLSWTEHIEHPSDMYNKGQEVEAVVLNIDEQSKKVSLGIKQLSQDPWTAIREQYPVGTIVDGKVSKITNFGAFVKLPSGIEGLVHISELSDETVDKVEDILKVGQTAQFRVINVNQEERKLGLSLKLEPKEKEAKPREIREPRENRESREPREKSVSASESPRPKQAAPKGKRETASRYETTTTATNGSKPKSMLQLELEKHAARQQGEDKSSSEE
jgi:small subunit ribosomal protein S1